MQHLPAQKEYFSLIALNEKADKNVERISEQMGQKMHQAYLFDLTMDEKNTWPNINTFFHENKHFL